MGAEAGVAQGGREQEQEEELNEEGEEPLEPAEQAGRLCLALYPVPEPGERHRHPAPTQLQDVEQGDQGGRPAEEEPKLGEWQPQEGHLRKPPLRKMCSTSSSKGREVEARKRGTWRPAQKSASSRQYRSCSSA